jgi:hypothetical protein
MESHREHGRRSGRRTASSAVSIGLLLLGFTVPLGAGARPENSDSLSPFVRGSLDKALSSVLSRIEGDRCRRIFSEFQDARGRSLASILDDLHVTARSYLSGVRFESGQGSRPCEDSRVAGFTHLHTRTIYLCERFAVIARQNPRLGAALLLHEALHTLGLPENPPLSVEITQRVLERCGG